MAAFGDEFSAFKDAQEPSTFSFVLRVVHAMYSPMHCVKINVDWLDFEYTSFASGHKIRDTLEGAIPFLNPR